MKTDTVWLCWLICGLEDDTNRMLKWTCESDSMSDRVLISSLDFLINQIDFHNLHIICEKNCLRLKV